MPQSRLDLWCNKRHSTPVVPFRLIPQPGVPIADQVVFAAKKAMFSGRLRPGDAFPSVRALGRAMKIHANTAQKVIAQLTAEGLLEVRPGIGTVVVQPPAARAGRGRLLARDVEQLDRAGDAARHFARRTAGLARRVLARPAKGGRTMIRTENLTKRYRRNDGAPGRDLRSPRRQRLRAGRPQRRGQEHAPSRSP